MNFKRLIFISVFLLVNKLTFAFDWNPVINAVAKVESNNNKKAIKGDQVGLLQIRPILVHECNRILKQRKSSKRYSLQDRWSSAKSKEMFILIQSHYNPHNNIEKAIRMWNGGPKYFNKHTQHYYLKVKKQMDLGKLTCATIRGGGTRVKNPTLLMGTDEEYDRGVLLDANAVKEVVTEKINEVIDGAPEALDTLKEIVEHLEDYALKEEVIVKENKLVLENTSSTNLSAEIGKYYYFTSEVNTLSVTLPTTTDISSVILYMSTGTTPNITFDSTSTILYLDGFALEASKTYEVNCLFNGAAWVLMAAEINTGS